MVFDSLKLFFRAKRDMKAFNALPQKDRKIVFYAEDTHSKIHFEGIISQLTAKYGETICYLTSAHDDTVLHSSDDRIKKFYIGDGLIRSVAFRTLKADLVIMTMPDLENYHLKRSQTYPVHYLYLFHAMVSTHSNYRQAAFDHYDTVFCTGPFQINEIRATEKIYGLKPKHLYKDGYRRLESIINDVKKHRASVGEPSVNGVKTVIIAPSWGENAILESCGIKTISVLLEAGYRTIVRPHPMTTKHKPELINSIISQFANHQRFQLQTDIRDHKTLYESHVMISDWSGVAMEYAFACERPVIFIDVPKKCNNPEADRVTQIPIEVSIRDKIGKIIPPNQLDLLPKAIEDIYQDSEKFIEQIRQTRDVSVFNLGNSLNGAVEEILKIANK
ncbi:CDP-glycerol glycerophosphotransferase family protein [Oceanicoccus sp. KOV_DT_Chl]|uniref:CDP-glycerol glycerophosphotransferase family protein n=1 Tax=Oceanicoccus sp. KOV_DT_Chl TaxID=1904639 RepID=UPI000C7AE4E7|nr:CDP-glycerol glycerophosphotransferase family protein [Oceanicoccus sp. KOV_DT_Chl]